MKTKKRNIYFRNLSESASSYICPQKTFWDTLLDIIVLSENYCFRRQGEFPLTKGRVCLSVSLSLVILIFQYIRYILPLISQGLAELIKQCLFHCILE